MLNCKYRGVCYDNPYCKRDGGYCTLSRLIWCKGIVMGIFFSIATAYFAYGIVYAWQHAGDGVDLLKKVQINRIESEKRMDELELQLKQYNETITNHWKWELKELEKLKSP